jgi:hypothetical protein
MMPTGARRIATFLGLMMRWADSLVTLVITAGLPCPPIDRRRSFTGMIDIALPGQKEKEYPLPAAGQRVLEEPAQLVPPDRPNG